MSVTTRSKFYYGHLIDDTNLRLDFDEGGGELTAILSITTYTLEEYVTELIRAMNVAGGQTYIGTLDRDTREITISAPGTFNLLLTSGTHAGTSTFALAGFTGADTGLATSHTGNLGSGSEFRPQFVLQKYVPTSQIKNPTSVAVNVSTSNIVEVVRFGSVRFMECNIKWVTDTDVGVVDYLDNSQTAVADLIAFMEAATDKQRLEFMEDRDDSAIFENLLLESTADSQMGVGYKIHEMLGLNLPGWYESKKLLFRKVD